MSVGNKFLNLWKSFLIVCLFISALKILAHILNDFVINFLLDFLKCILAEYKSGRK